MGTRRVVILFQFPLVGRAIERLLETINDIQVVACVPDEPEGWARVPDLHPDVVIQVCEHGAALAAAPPLSSEEVLRLIRLEATGNDMRVYQARRMTATCIDDLIQVIRTSGECADGGSASS